MPLEVIPTIPALRQRVAAARQAGATVELVPTMGALHAGHVSLVEHARREHACVVVSIFVNPLQFDRRDDLDAYPRTLEADVALLEHLGVDLVFAPSAAEMYPLPLALGITLGPLADHLCGGHRPGHFQGMATVVMKLFQIVQADRAYFGEKDAQQLAIIRRLVADFNVPVEVVGLPTVREADGLAMSSRNRRLTPEQRVEARALYSALSVARAAIESGETDTAAVMTNAAALVPTDGDLRLEYLDIVDPLDMQPLTRVSGTVVIAGALWVGPVRLIDNLRVPARAS